MKFGPHWGLELPRGAIVGMVRLIACKPTDDLFNTGLPSADSDDFECGDFAPGRFAWERDQFIQFERPARC